MKLQSFRINLSKRLRLSGAHRTDGEGGWIIVLNVGGRVTGFSVERVTRVIKVQADDIKPPPDLVVSGLKSDYIRGVCRQDQRLLAVLDFNRILLVDEFKKLSAINKTRDRAVTA